LKRPGRFDVHVPLHNAVPTQAIELYKHFYPLEEYKCPINAAEEKQEPITGFIDQEDLRAYADKFARNIFDCGVEVSMAALQGFLLRYKKNPKKAAVEVETWAREMKEEQDEKVRKREARREEKANRNSGLACDQSPTQASDV
jgi:chaperone BCS1